MAVKKYYTLENLMQRIDSKSRVQIEKRVQRTLRQMRLKDLREAKNMSQTALARKLKVKQPAISKIENGKNISLGKLQRYIRATGAELHLYATYPNGKKIDITNLAGL